MAALTRGEGATFGGGFLAGRAIWGRDFVVCLTEFANKNEEVENGRGAGALGAMKKCTADGVGRRH